MARLSLIHFASLLPFGVIHRDSSLCALDIHDYGDHTDSNESDDHQQDTVYLSLVRLLERRADRGREPSYNAREYQHRDTVTDTLLSNLFAEPHHEHSAGYKRYHCRQRKRGAGIIRHWCKKAYSHPCTLNSSKSECTVTRVLRNLAATRLTFLFELV